MTDTMISILISRLILNLRKDFLRTCNRRGITNDSGAATVHGTMTNASGDGRRTGGAFEDVSNMTVQFAHNLDEDGDGEDEAAWNNGTVLPSS